ncbi:unnamed protein product [Chrysoparadoxa australica]
MTLLVIGGTGTLGRQIVRKALENGFQVRCIVRNKRAANFLTEWGAELVYGDLTLPETLPLSFQGVTAVIDASTTRPEDDSETIDVDWYGKLMLIELAKQVNVKRFIFFSILNSEKYDYISIMNMKNQIENVLENSGIPFTIFKCAGFFQGLINQYAIPILEEKTVWVTGDSHPISYIDTEDAANFCIKSLSITKTVNKTFFLGTDQALLSQDIINICEKLSGQKANLKIIPSILLKFLRQFTGFFEWSLKISERLAFIEVLSDNEIFDSSKNTIFEIFQIEPNELLSVESYLKEYFEMMLLTLENLNFETYKKNKNLII